MKQHTVDGNHEKDESERLIHMIKILKNYSNVAGKML